MTDFSLIPLGTAVGAMAAAAVAPAASAFAETVTVTKFLDRPDGRIAYDDGGAGPLVVMVPGLGDLRQEYRFLAPLLAQAGYRAVTMDLRGHGESSTGWPSYRTAAVGGDIVALIEHLNAGPAAIVGTSMGAGAAVWAAAEAPDRVSQLVLIGPFVREVPPESWIKGLMQTLMIKVAFAGPWAKSAWIGYYRSLYPTAKPADFAAYRAALAANLSEPGRLAALEAMTGVDGGKSDIEARLGEVRAPTLVVMGTSDPDFPDPAAEAATVARLLNGSARMIAGAGHYPHAEMPEVTSPLVIDFLAAGLRS